MQEKRLRIFLFIEGLKYIGTERGGGFVYGEGVLKGQRVMESCVRMEGYKGEEEARVRRCVVRVKGEGREGVKWLYINERKKKRERESV